MWPLGDDDGDNAWNLMVRYVEKLAVRNSVKRIQNGM